MLNSRFSIGEVVVGIESEGDADWLATFADRFPAASQEPHIMLVNTAKGIVCEWTLRNNEKPVKLQVDIEKFVAQQRSFPAPKQGALNQALGRKTRTILDTTGGWGSDAMLMCSQGYIVSVLERNPIMFLLIQDAMRRLGMTNWAGDQNVPVPTVIEDDAIRYLSTLPVSTHNTGESFDCLYLDPMFPQKKKQSAAVNKYIQFLQFLVGPDNDATALLNAALTSGTPRVVVKRPHYADPLLREPEQRFSSKLVHYDVYFAH